MNNLNLLFIFILTLLPIARLAADKYWNDKHNLAVFFTQLKMDDGFFLKEVFIKEKNSSISMMFSNSKLSQSITRWEDPDVYKLSHVLNLVLSCEYSNITYYYIRLIDKWLSQCRIDLNSIDISHRLPSYLLSRIKKGALNPCVETFKTILLQNILKQIPSMIYTLANLAKFAKNVIFKNHDILRIFLSWYVYIDQKDKIDYTNEKFEVGAALLDSIMITNFQMKKRLKRFGVKYCRLPVSFEKIDKEVDNIDMKTQSLDLFDTRDTRLDLLTYPSFIDKPDKYIIKPDSNFNELINHLTQEVPNGVIEVTWPKIKIDMKLVFESYIKTSIDIREIIRYEKILIEVVNDISSLKLIKQINKIIANDNDSTEKTTECKDQLSYFNELIKGLGDDPIDVLNLIIKTKSQLSVLCIHLESSSGQITDSVSREITNIISALKSSLIHVTQILPDGLDYYRFIYIFSKNHVCAKLHPVVLNSFWEQQSLYYSPEMELYGIDYQHLYTSLPSQPVQNLLCHETSVTLNTMEIMENEMRSCIEKNQINDIENPYDSCFPHYNINYKKVIRDIAYITLNTSSPHVFDWEKMLLTLIYNKKHVKLFNEIEQKQFCSAVVVERLVEFIYTIRSLLLEKQYVKCICIESEQNKTYCQDGFWTSENTTYKWRGPKEDLDINQIENMILTNVLLYEKHFRTITDVVEKLRSDKFIVNSFFHHIELFWDGVEKSLEVVYDGFKYFTFDLQDSYDYINVFIKWIISIEYSRIMNHLTLINKEKIEANKNNIDGLLEYVNYFSEIDWVKSTNVKYLITYCFSLVFLVTKGRYDLMATQIQDILYKEFQYLGIKKTYILKEKDMSNWVTMYKSEVDDLKNILKN